MQEMLIAEGESLARRETSGCLSMSAGSSHLPCIISISASLISQSPRASGCMHVRRPPRCHREAEVN
jgi:hypothetical protein